MKYHLTPRINQRVKMRFSDGRSCVGTVVDVVRSQTGECDDQIRIQFNNLQDDREEVGIDRDSPLYPSRVLYRSAFNNALVK